MATVFTQAASPLKLNLHAPKPASRFDDLSFDPMDASPLPARGLAAAEEFYAGFGGSSRPVCSLSRPSRRMSRPRCSD